MAKSKQTSVNRRSFLKGAATAAAGAAAIASPVNPAGAQTPRDGTGRTGDPGAAPASNKPWTVAFSTR